MAEYKNRKGIAGILVILVVIVVFSAAGAWYFFFSKPSNLDKSATTQTPSGEKMTVAKYYWPGTFWVEIAEEKGYFTEEGLNVEVVDTNPDYYASLQAVADGELDANNFPLYDFLSYSVSGSPLVAVLSGDISTGANGIVASSSIKSISDLSGKKVGLAKGTFSEYMLEYVLKQNNISDVEVVEVNTEDTVSVLSSGETDAVVSWEPLMTETVDKLGANKIFDTSQAFGLDSSVWVFRKEFVEGRPGDVAAFTRVWQKTTDYILANEDEAFAIIAENYGIALSDVKGYVTLDKILSLDESRKRFAYSTGIDSNHGLLVGMNEFMIGRGLTEKLIRTETLLDSSFIDSLE